MISKLILFEEGEKVFGADLWVMRRKLARMAAGIRFQDNNKERQHN